MKFIPKQIINSWILAYKEGCTIKEIAAKSGVSRYYVYKYLEETGVLKIRKSITTKIIKEWVRLYKEGRTVKEIAAKNGRHITTIYRYLDGAGALKKRKSITMKMIKEWVELYKTGSVNCAWLSRKYGVRVKTVRKYLHLQGVKTTRKVPHLVWEE